nr:ATP-binding protein [uncultured Roseococcus sp.]
MSALHLPTISIFSAILSSFLGLAMLWLWLHDRREPALASWALNRLLSALATVLLGLRGIAPDWLSIDLANTVVCLSFGLGWTGARQFEGRPPLTWAIFAGAGVWLAACQFPGFYADTDARVALVALLLIAYNGLTLREFVRGQRTLPLPSRPLFIALLAGVTVAYLALTSITLAFLPRPPGQLPHAYWLGALLLLNIVLLCGGTLLLVALTKEKAEARSTAALAAARDAADRASLQKTRFLSRMSHELRTPLNAVLGLAQVLADDRSLGPEQQRKAETLEQAGRHLLAILNDVLDISRIEAGHFLPMPRPLGLAKFLDDMLALLKETAAARDVTLVLRLDPALPPIVSADALRLRQILMNLLANAIRFTPSGGTVSLEVLQRGSETCFAVTDTGSGVPAALRPHLFEEFSQAEGDQALAGSGLGLAISAALAGALGGRLTHEDGPEGRGSRFTLLLPLPIAEPVRAEVPPPLPAEPPARQGLNILVVDDIATNRLVAAELLKAAGHRVVQAPSGQFALTLLEREPLPDLVLMDERMPGLNGSDTVRLIRAMPGPVAGLPIVAVTADVLPAQIKKMMAAGFDDHLTKPMDRGELLAALERWGYGSAARPLPS